MDFRRLRSRVKMAILMTDIDGWKDGTYADDGEAWKYANAAVDIIDRMRASQDGSKSESVLPMAEVVGQSEQLVCEKCKEPMVEPYWVGGKKFCLGCI